jgi:Tol biopolymer transport system component
MPAFTRLSANKILLLVIAIATVLFACQKTNPVVPRQGGHTITDTLLIYGQQGGTGKWNVVLHDYKNNSIKPILFNATYPSATNIRVVYIKDDSILGYANLDGVSRLLLTLPHPKYPQLSIDTRLICLIDQPDSNTYELLKYDTLGNKTVLYHSNYEMTYPSFSSDGTKIAFTQKTKKGESSIFLVNIYENDGLAHRVTPEDSTFYDDYPTITNETIYFVRSHMVNSVLSSEIFASSLGGSTITQLTNFTNNWTTPSFFIKDLRKVANGIDSSKLICVSNYKNPETSNVYLYEIGTDSLERVTNEAFLESSPSLIPNWVKNK